jgi:uncharacterized membrane protein
MADSVIYGPMQLIVAGFGDPNVPMGVVNELRRVREAGIVRMVDAVFVSKDDEGDLIEIKATDLDDDELVLLGTLAGALFGAGAGGEDGALLGAEIGGLAAEEGEFGLDEDDINEIADLIPPGSAVLFLLLEHLWAKGLKGSFLDAGGSILAHGWITPATLIAMGEDAAAEDLDA